MVGWAAVAGMHLRTELWRSTRSIHFAHDTDNAMHFGGDAIRDAEKLAHLPPFADANSPQSDGVTANARRLTNQATVARHRPRL